jgi:hypothetical protein
MLPGHDGTSNIVYDEAGTVHCYDCTSQPIVRHPMAYIGHEPQRETLKYRCPARHEGWTCPHDEVCNAGKSYGKTVRVKQTIDLRQRIRSAYSRPQPRAHAAGPPRIEIQLSPTALFYPSHRKRLLTPAFRFAER